jgi:hypothetical protein
MKHNRGVVDISSASRSFARTVRAAFRVDPRRSALVSTSLLLALVMTSGGVVGLVGQSDKASSTHENSAGLQNSDGTSGGGSSTTASTTDSSDTTSSSSSTNSTAGNPAAASNGDEEQGQDSGGNWGRNIDGEISLRILAEPGSVRTGQPIDLRAELRDSNGAMLAMQWDLGDGTIRNVDSQSCAAAINTPTVNDGRTEFDNSFTHTFRAPGTYEVVVSARTGSRCGANAAEETITVSRTVTVTGETLTNGPSQPRANVGVIGGGTEGDPRLAIDVRGEDPDGYISKIVIDWDDQGPPTVMNYPLDACERSGNKWPSSSRSLTPEHTYEASGEYDVTVTVTSTGCDGTQSQQAIAVLSGVRVD